MMNQRAARGLGLFRKDRAADARSFVIRAPGCAVICAAWEQAMKEIRTMKKAATENSVTAFMTCPGIEPGFTP
jgi:hypothetical protein